MTLTKLIVVFVALFALFVGVESQNTNLKRIDQSKFGRNLLDTLQIQLQAGKSTDAIENLLVELSTNMQKDDEEATQEHTDKVASLEAQIDGLKDDIAQEESDLADAQDRSSEASTNIEAVNSQITDLETEESNDREFLGRITAIREAAHEVFLTRSAELDNAITVLYQVAEVVADLHSSVSSDASFLQKDHVVILAQVSSKLGQIKKIQRYSPLLRLIQQITELPNNQPDMSLPSEAAGSLKDLLNNLAALIKNELNQIFEEEHDLQAIYDEQKDNINANLDMIAANLTSLGAELSRLQGLLADAEHDIETHTKQLEELRQTHDDVNEILNNENLSYETASRERAEKLSIVRQALDIVRNRLGQMKGYLDDRVTQRMSSEV